ISQKEKLQDKYFRDIDVIFHMAALADIVPSINNPEDYYKSNVQGTLNLLEKARKHKVKKFIYAASSSCYGLPKKLPVLEKAIISPQYPYALTKYLGECIAMHWAQVYRIPTTSLRFFNIYGPRARTSGTYGAVFGVFLAQKLANKPFTIVGDGTQTRDFTYVTDAVDAIVTAMMSSHVGLFNVGSGNTYSINRLVELLEGDTVNIPKRPGEPDSTFADIRKVEAELGWTPKVSFEEGVDRVLKAIDYWQDAPLWNPNSIEAATKTWFEFLS
ncbi:MAG: NAD-dependent epimerase/dehydratase family protein, partial [Alphaproteobacteria bacterium]|nr:NAD-dependent epimerase/dehydratase family protein [Alphaproteobacteria bacterium]